MQNRTTTSTARVAFLFVVAALVLQAAPAWAMPAPGSRPRVGHSLTGASARHSMDRYGAHGAHFGSPTASAFAPGGHAAALAVRALERPLDLATLTLAGGTGFTPATAPTAVRRLRE
jgi:hypothetical protein